LLSLSSLGCLALTNSKVTDEGIRKLPELPNLRSIMLHDSVGVTDAGIAALAPCFAIEELNVDGTSITDAGVKHLERVINLKNLSLARTGVTDGALESLEQMTQLKGLNLESTQVSQEGLARLQAAIPSCRIKWSAAPASPGKESVARRPPPAAEKHASDGRYDGLAVKRWVSLLPMPDKLIGWYHERTDSATRQNGLLTLVDGRSWCALTSRDQIVRVSVMKLSGTRLKIGVRGAAVNGVGHAYAAHFLPAEKQVMLELWRPDGSILIRGPAPALAADSFEFALVAVGGTFKIFFDGAKAMEWHESSHKGAGAMTIQCDGTAEITAIDCQVLDGTLVEPVRTMAVAPGDLDREAAEWTLAVGGKLTVLADGQPKAVRQASEVPAGPFKTVAVDLSAAIDGINTAGLEKLARLTALERVDLAGRDVGDVPVAALARATPLKELDLRGTKATPAAVTKLQAALPNCKIQTGPLPNPPAAK
jgi:hypothetical protein